MNSLFLSTLLLALAEMANASETHRGSSNNATGAVALQHPARVQGFSDARDEFGDLDANRDGTLAGRTRDEFKALQGM